MPRHAALILVFGVIALAAACGGDSEEAAGVSGSADCREELEGGPQLLPDDRDPFPESFPTPPVYVVRPAVITSPEGNPIVLLLVDGSADELVDFWSSSLPATGFQLGETSVATPGDLPLTIISFSRGRLEGELRIRVADEPFEACSDVTLTYG